MESLLIYDTTLRDGTQGENISFTVEEKIKIAGRLDDIGIHYIEGGWPGSNPRDKHFFHMARHMEFQTTRLVAFGATRRPGISPEDDRNLHSLLGSEAPVISLFGKTWDLHVQQVMNNTLEENLAMIHDSITYLKDHERDVFYDAEHFFDGFKNNPDYAIQTLEAALNGGADYLVLCDTNGGTLPHEIESILQTVKQQLNSSSTRKNPLRLGIHTHNDCGLAVANSIAAVRAGASMVQGTINGYGERCGNADLTTIIPILCIKMGYPCLPDAQLKKLTKISRFVSETANMIPLNSRPFVGKSAFAHKGGIHVSAIMKESRAYEHIHPEMVGNTRRVLMSDLSGKSNVEYKARELGIDLDQKGLDSRKIVSTIKNLEQEGYQFDVADGSFKILMEKMTNRFKPFFELRSFRIASEKDQDQICHSFATIKIVVDGKQEITAAEGRGPVNALDNALRKALEQFYKTHLDAMHLVDFKVRVMEGREGTAAKVRVLIESRDKEELWSTIGVSEDIIEASWQALADSFQYKLSKEKSDKEGSHVE
jgi:2-isopropylmalate synthase